MIARATFTVDADGSVSSVVDYQPTRVDLDGHVIEPATPATHPQTHARTVAAVESLGPGACAASPR